MGMLFLSPHSGRHYVASGPLFSRWRADDCQPVHSAGIALCLRSHRAAVFAQWLAAAGGDGPDLRARRLTGGGRRRLGGASQSVRSLARVAVRCAIRADAVAAAPRRAADPATGGGRRSSVGSGGRRCAATSRRLVLDRRRHRPALGTVRGTDSRAGADRCSAAGGQHRHYLAVAGLRRRCRDLARRCIADWW